MILFRFVVVVRVECNDNLESSEMNAVLVVVKVVVVFGIGWIAFTASLLNTTTTATSRKESNKRVLDDVDDVDIDEQMKLR